VVFDRRLLVPPSARLFSTLGAGPVIIVTTPEALASHPSRAQALEAAGAQLEPIKEGNLRAAFQRLGERQVMSLLLEGGPMLQKAAAAANLVDAVQLYVAPHSLGEDGVRWLAPDELPIASLADRQVTPCGPDVFMEGYVHRID
jgi:diaminohydroxyphosphoribosylaminopyrimidine deaminase/5-amino-6-(5-phosphoribosylamino)uracil reductase